MLKETTSIKISNANFRVPILLDLFNLVEGNKIRTIKGTLLYGKNGSGKSTITRSFRKTIGDPLLRGCLLNIAQKQQICKNIYMKQYELTKEQWERVKRLLPPERTGKRSRPRKDDRTMLNGILWIMRSGTQWRELLEVYGPWQSVHTRFAKWWDDDMSEKVFHALSSDANIENLSMDSTCIKVHESTNDGMNIKLHTIVDCLWDPVTFLLSARNDHDSTHAIQLLEQVNISSNVLADRAHELHVSEPILGEYGGSTM